jgi:hypothetical protein
VYLVLFLFWVLAPSCLTTSIPINYRMWGVFFFVFSLFLSGVLVAAFSVFVWHPDGSNLG